MATINLGKVVPVYKGTYSAGTYQKYEVVFDGESSFISLVDNNVTALANDGTHWLYLCRGNNTAYVAQAALIAANDAAILSAAPIVPYVKRVEAISGGTISSKKSTGIIFDGMQDLLPYTDILICPEAGLKIESGKVSALYDLKNTKDATQATAANQPYLAGFIAPNEKKAIKNMKTSTDVYLGHTLITKANTASWSIITTLKYMGERGTGTSGGLYAGLAGDNCLYVDRSCEGKIGQTFVDGEARTAAGVIYPYIGKNITVIWTYNNGAIRCYLNGIQQELPIISSPSLSLAISSIGGNSTYPLEQFAGNIYYHQILSKELSASEVATVSSILAAQYPDIEGVNIGNQHWATSNYEGVVTGNGTVIPEVQGVSTAVATERCQASVDFTAAGWSASGGCVIDSATQATITGTGWLIFDPQFYQYPRELLIHMVASLTAGTVEIRNGYDVVGSITKSGSIDFSQSTQWGNNVSGLSLRFDTTSVFTASVISVKEVGWADLTTPAWSYYNNDVALGAIYGKLYNRYALDAIALNPPSGWRVPILADITQLSTYLGGNAVSGGKLKKDGLVYWDTYNAGGTNESGMSFIPAGIRSEVGVFSNNRAAGYLSILNGYNISITSTNPALLIYSGEQQAQGGFIRLIRTSPVGEQVQKLTTGVFTTDISSSYKLLNIPFGYQVTAIKVKCDSAVSAFEAKMYDYAGSVLQATLVTGKTAAAGVDMKFGITVDCAVQYNDPQLRFTCTKATSTSPIEISAVLEKIL